MAAAAAAAAAAAVAVAVVDFLAHLFFRIPFKVARRVIFARGLKSIFPNEPKVE